MAVPVCSCKQVPVYIPPEPEQVAIANRLAAVDAICVPPGLYNPSQKPHPTHFQLQGSRNKSIEDGLTARSSNGKKPNFLKRALIPCRYNIRDKRHS